MDLSFAVNTIKANMAHERVQKRIANERLVKPNVEIPDATEEDVKAEYVKMGGLLAATEAVEEMEERAKHNDFVKKSGAATKLKEIVSKVKTKKK